MANAGECEMEMNMLTESEQRAAALERLSALMDGELEADAALQACVDWRSNGESQSSWHAYHVIGDVLRSDDLACAPASDAAFLEAFRKRLASEPIVFAPQSPSAPTIEQPLPARVVVNAGRGSRWSWMAPSAVAAGFVAVAGVLALTRSPSVLDPRDGSGAPQIAAVTTPERASVVAASLPASNAAPSEPQVFVANGQFIRDARLDRYLAAHKQFAGMSALGVPSAFLRNATADAGDR
jgi:sigma-E factor negative regulatory protein RseA